MFGVFTLQLPSSLQTKLSLLSQQQKAGAFGGVFLMGMIADLSLHLVHQHRFQGLALCGAEWRFIHWCDYALFARIRDGRTTYFNHLIR